MTQARTSITCELLWAQTHRLSPLTPGLYTEANGSLLVNDDKTVGVAPASLLAPELKLLRPVSGQRLVNRYTVLKPLGEGGMGLVLAAYDERLDRRVALKLMANQQEDVKRLVRESQA